MRTLHRARSVLRTKDRACVDVCPVQCIYEFDPVNNHTFFVQLSRDVFAD
jgi:hypothetical protein